MTLKEAIKSAQLQGASMIYQQSRTWHHRGINTEFSDDDYEVSDWEVCDNVTHFIPNENEEIL